VTSSSKKQASAVDIIEASGRNRLLGIKHSPAKKAGFYCMYMRSKTAARDRLLGEDMPGVSCRLLDI
jgi:hypothetical protein